jgi:histidinol-phosphatase (PHP family)
MRYFSAIKSFCMSWTNYHGHCHYCDGNGAPVDYIVAAISKGMPSLGFSSHAPVPFESFWNMPQHRLNDYVIEIKQLKAQFAEQVDVLLSLEIDYVEDVMGPSDAHYASLGLDYTIGSVHFMGEFGNGERWAIDGSFESFQRGLDDIYQGNIKRLVCEFFEKQRNMLVAHRPTIIGHFDKIKMHNAVKPLFDENAPWYRNEVRHLLEVASRCGTIIEINTKSLSRNGMLFPDASCFSWLRELKLPIVLNSDAHYPNHLDAGFAVVAQQLLDNGIVELMLLKNNVWNAVGFSYKGVS